MSPRVADLRTAVYRQGIAATAIAAVDSALWDLRAKAEGKMALRSA